MTPAFTVISRTTASNTDVVTKDAQTAPSLLNAKRKKTSAKAPDSEIVVDSKPENTGGGMCSDEDDTLDCQLALSSPIKGSDHRKLNQVLCHCM